MIFGFGANHTFTPDTVVVPGLDPGKSHAGNGSFRKRFGAILPLGTYPTRLCADGPEVMTERNEENRLLET